MTKQLKRTLSLLLAMIMVVGTFAVFPLTSSADPYVIADCTYQNGDTAVYANVPFDPGTYSELVNGAIFYFTGGMGSESTPVIMDAMGYSYAFYDQTGTELTAALVGAYNFSGADAGFDDIDTLYQVQYEITFSAGMTALYIVATEPAPAHTHDGVTFSPWTSTDSLPTSGDYYLTADVTVSSTTTVSVSDTLNLCLNGHSILSTGNGHVFNVPGTMNLYDCNGSNRTHYVTLNNWRGIAVSDSGTESAVTDGSGVVKVTGGLITGGNVTYSPGGGAFRVDGTFAMYGGTLIGNYAQYETTKGSGGAIWSSGSTTIAGNSRITCNYSEEGGRGGVYITNNGTLNISGTPDLTGNSVRDIVMNGSSKKIKFTSFDPNVRLGVIYYTGNPSNIEITTNANFADDAAVRAVMQHSNSDRSIICYNGQAKIVNAYTVTWNNYNGTNLETDTGVLAGAAPSYDGETPVKPDDDTFTYTFAGWNDGTNTYALNEALPQVNGDITFTAVFTSAVKTYTVTWKNGDTVLETDTGVEAGSLPSFEGTMPTKADDDTYTYTFAGWNDGTTTYGLTDTLPAVTGDVTYTAVFTEEPIIKDPTVEADGLYIKVSNVGDFKYVLVISGEYDNYKDIKTNKDKADYYYGITAPKLDQAGGSYAFTIPAAGIYTVCVRRSDGTDLTYTVTVEAPAAPAHSFNVEVAGTVVTFTTDSEIKIVRFALGEGITNMTDMRAAAGVRGYLGMRFASGSFTMTVLPAGTYSYAVEYTDGIQEFGEFTVEENASKTPIITAEGVTGDWSLIARIKYAPGTITDPADFRGVAGLRVLYAPETGDTATYRKGVLTGAYSFVVIYTDGTYELINKTF